MRSWKHNILAIIYFYFGSLLLVVNIGLRYQDSELNIQPVVVIVVQHDLRICSVI